MKRPEQHETDSAGQRLVRDALEPVGWVVRSVVEHDYGFDFEVEVFARRTPIGLRESTGILFKAQLKSSTATSYSASGDFISEPVRVANLKYLACELNTPTILLHADVVQKRLFWHALQLDRDLDDGLVQAGDNATLTVRISTNNALPQTVDALLEALASAGAVLAARAMSTVSGKEFYRIFTGRDNAALLRELNAKSDLLSLAEAERLRFDEPDAARALLERLLADPRASVQTKFTAELMSEPLEVRSRQKAGAPDEQLSSVDYESALRLCNLAKDGPPYLRLFALIRRTVAEFNALLYQDWGLYLNWKGHESGGDALWGAQIQLQRAALAGSLARKHRQCIRITNLGLRSPHRWALADAVGRLSHVVMKFATQARAQGYQQAAEDLEQHAFEICKVEARCASEAGDEAAVTTAATNALIISSDPDSETCRWAIETMKKVKEERHQKRFALLLDHGRRRRAGEEFPDDFKTTSAQIYQIMANAMGIDLTDENDPIAKMVRIGIDDLNPERVLRDCEHISVRLAPSGRIANALRLPTAGSKLLRCKLHGHAMGATSLDRGHQLFKEKFCDSCQDRSPRPATWVWTGKPES